MLATTMPDSFAEALRSPRYQTSTKTLTSIIIHGATAVLVSRVWDLVVQPCWNQAYTMGGLLWEVFSHSQQETSILQMKM